MKVALLYLNKGGGIANCTCELAKALSRDHEVTCYMSSENMILSKFEDIPCKIRTFTWSRGRVNLLAAMLSNRDSTGIAKEILDDNPDLVMDTGSWWWRRVVFADIKNKIALAEIVHDPTPHPGPMRLFYNLHHRLFPSKADIVIALSAFCFNEMVKKYHSKNHVKSKHGIIIPSANIDADTIASKRKKMLFFGLIEPYKGLDVLIDAYAIAKATVPDIELTVAGRGRIDDRVMRLIHASDIELINDYIPESRVPELIARHGVMVLPYTYATQSGVAAVALANGLPCIATNVGALPEQVQDSKNGIIVAPGNAEELANAMCKIAVDYELAKRMSEESDRIGREEYSWDKIASDLMSELESIIANIKASNSPTKQGI